MSLQASYHSEKIMYSDLGMVFCGMLYIQKTNSVQRGADCLLSWVLVKMGQKQKKGLGVGRES